MPFLYNASMRHTIPSLILNGTDWRVEAAIASIIAAILALHTGGLLYNAGIKATIPSLRKRGRRKPAQSSQRIVFQQQYWERTGYWYEGIVYFFYTSSILHARNLLFLTQKSHTSEG